MNGYLRLREMAKDRGGRVIMDFYGEVFEEVAMVVSAAGSVVFGRRG